MSKKIKRLIIILGILAVAVITCVGLGYYYILAPNTSVKDEGFIYTRTVIQSLRFLTLCEDRDILKTFTPSIR